MLSTSQNYLGAPLKTSVFDFSSLTFFKKTISIICLIVPIV